MATEQEVKTLMESLVSALAFREKSLESRAEWGSIKFEKASQDFGRIFQVLTHLSVLPVEYLTDAAISQIRGEIDAVIKLFEQINQFNIEQGNATQLRDSLITQVHSRADQLYTVASPWIPFLAYQKGDVAKNIEALTESVKKAQGLVEEAKGAVENRKKEIEGIVTLAREASAAAGAAVFTHDFKNEANTLEERSKTWLKVTGGLAVITLAFASLMWLVPIDGTDPIQITQRVAGKLAMLAVLFTTTLWCGRTYKALMHLATINRHRALSLQTFQAFSHAASDDATKDAVLMEATRAIFGSAPTGFLDGKASADQDLKIIEVAKTLGSKGGGPT
ncbi:MAG: hypothetical protein KJZ92_08780 [Rhodocyclaceae bacterium]|nr:hypothetical protein [Rhodocyclaceae bacterium]